MKQTLFLLITLFIVQSTFGQNVLTLQPDGGLNNGTDSGTATSGKDTWVNRYAPNDNNGSTAVIYGDPRSNCNTSDAKAYIQFDVNNLPDLVDSVFFGVTHIDHNTYCYSNCDADFYFYYVTSPWDEMSMIYANEPSEDTAAFYGPINITFPNDFQNQEYDITNAYNKWKSNTMTNYGFTIYSPTLGCNNASVRFLAYSSDDTLQSRRPYLKIYYRFPASVNDQNYSNEINAYPNPFSNILIVAEKDFDIAYLTDLSGRKIEVFYDDALKGFNTSAIYSGMYILQLEKNNQTKSMKVYKTN